MVRRKDGYKDKVGAIRKEEIRVGPLIGAALVLFPGDLGARLSGVVHLRVTEGVSGPFLTMIVEPDYKGHRIEVDAEFVDGAWNARVRIRCTLSEEPPHVETVTCRKATAQLAEVRAAVWGRQWVERHGPTA